MRRWYTGAIGTRNILFKDRLSEGVYILREKKGLRALKEDLLN